MLRKQVQEPRKFFGESISIKSRNIYIQALKCTYLETIQFHMAIGGS